MASLRRKHFLLSKTLKFFHPLAAKGSSPLSILHHSYFNLPLSYDEKTLKFLSTIQILLIAILVERYYFSYKKVGNGCGQGAVVSVHYIHYVALCNIGSSNHMKKKINGKNHNKRPSELH